MTATPEQATCDEFRCGRPALPGRLFCSWHSEQEPAATPEQAKVERVANDFAVKVTEHAIMELNADEENTAQIEAFGARVEGEFRAAIAALSTDDERLREALRDIANAVRLGSEYDVLAWANLAQACQDRARAALAPTKEE